MKLTVSGTEPAAGVAVNAIMGGYTEITAGGDYLGAVRVVAMRVGKKVPEPG